MFVDLEYLDEATKVTMTFGRMNPISVGHEKLANKVISIARSKSSEPRIYLSHTQNARKDPLNYNQKLKYARDAFGNIVKTSTDRNIVQLLKSLQKEGVKEVTMVVGSDRVSNFRTFLNKYNGKDFTFDKITVVSAGHRDPDDAGVAGMSGTKLRSLAAKGDEKTFTSGLASGLSAKQKTKMFKDVRDGMNISEQKEKKNGKEIALKNEPLLKITDDELEAGKVSNDELEDFIDDEDDEELEPDEGDVEVAKYIFPDDEDEIENGGEEEDDDEEVNEIFNFIFEDEIKEKILNFQQRQKIAMRMRRLAPKMARLRKIRAKRMATPERLKFRARKAAMVLLRKRAAGKRGEKYKDLSRGEKMSIDRTLQARYKPAVLKKMINGFSRKLLPMIRKKEIARLKSHRAKSSEKKPITKNIIKPVGAAGQQTAGSESFNAQFDSFIINEEFETFTEVRGRKSAYADQGDEGDDNIIYQMRKVIALRGRFVTKFQDGSKLNVSVPDAKKIINMYNKVRLPKEKQAMIVRLMKNKKNFEAELAGKPNIPLTRKQQLTKHMRRDIRNEAKLGIDKRREAGQGEWRVTNKDLGVWTGSARSEKDAKEKAMRKWGVRKGKASSPLFMKHTKVVKEEAELEEGRMKELHGLIAQKKTAKEIAKIMKLDVKTIKALMDEDYRKEEVEVDEISKRTKQKYLDKAVPDHHKMFTGKKAATKNKMNRRRAAIQKVSKALKGKKHYADYDPKTKQYSREEVELDEFTKKDYRKNEDNNMHTENAVELARKFGTSSEYNKMVAIYKSHRKRGEISSSEQRQRDALVKKYLPKLKEDVDFDESFELFLEYPHGVSTGHPVATPTSHIAPVSSALVGSDEDPTDKDSKNSKKKDDSKAKVDTLLRLGLVPRKDLVKYRRALKGGDAALKHPELRKKVGDLLQRLLKITTSDQAIYSKLRLKASEKEKNEVDEAESPLDRRHEREKDRMTVRHARQKAASTVRNVRKKAMESLEKKSNKSGIPVAVLQEVFDREETNEKGFNRVNSFIAFGAARNLDSDLDEGLTADQNRDRLMGKLKKFDQSRTAAGKKSMFPQKTSSGKWHKMKKPGSITTMNVPDHEHDKYSSKGYKKVTEEHGAGEWGTDELTNQYKKDTPGQSEGHTLAFDYIMKPRIAPTAREIAMQESQPNKFTSETVLIFRTNKVGQVKEMRCPKDKVHEYLSRGWQRRS